MHTSTLHHQPLQRTQISLPLALRQQISHVKQPKQSLAEFIRQAIELKIKEENNSQAAHKKAWKNFVGSVKPEDHSEWSTDEKIMNYQHELRREPPGRRYEVSP